MIKKLFRWAFKDELERLEANSLALKVATEKYIDYENRIKNVLQNIDVSVDVHEHHNYSPSWAVVSIQGKKTDYLKFMDLGNSDAVEIKRFLRNFERDARIKIDASPNASHFLKIPRY